MPRDLSICLKSFSFIIRFLKNSLWKLYLFISRLIIMNILLEFAKKNAKDLIKVNQFLRFKLMIWELFIVNKLCLNIYDILI